MRDRKPKFEVGDYVTTDFGLHGIVESVWPPGSYAYVKKASFHYTLTLFERNAARRVYSETALSSCRADIISLLADLAE